MDYLLPEADKYPSVEVAGEAYREAEIVAALQKRPAIDEEIEVSLPAHLVPEPDNPYDPNAISVRVRGHVVGYIERDQTQPHLEAIHRIAASGHVAVTNARIWASRRTHWEGGDRFYSRISVALPYEGLQLPINDPPAMAYSLLPWGAAVQVTNEDAYFDNLRSFVPRSGQGLILVTLHRATRTLKGGQTRDVVEVRLNAHTVGELSTTTSRHYLPTIDHLNAAEVDVAAWARIQGSALGAEVKVQGQKATELSDAWLTRGMVALPALVPRAPHYSVPASYVPQRTTPEKRRQSQAAGAQQMNADTAKPGCAAVVLLLAGVAAIGTGLASHII